MPEYSINEAFLFKETVLTLITKCFFRLLCYNRDNVKLNAIDLQDGGNKMIRENQKYLNSLQVIIDALIIPLSFAFAYFVRFNILDGISSVSFESSMRLIVYLIPLYLICYSFADLYSSKRTHSRTKEAISILTCNIIVTLILVTILFINKNIHFSRGVIVLFPFINITNTMLFRLILRFALRKLRKKGYNLKHCLIIGTTPTASSLITKLRKHPFWGYNIIGIIQTDARQSEGFCGYPILGHTQDLDELFEEHHTDLVIIATEEGDASELGKMLKSCEKAGIKTHIIPYYYKYVPAKPYIDDLDGLPIIDTRHIPLDNIFKTLLKRCFDIVFSLCAIILTSPLLLFTAIMVKLSSPGPILFKQERVGVNRTTFYMYKFRSMKVQIDEEEVSKWTTKNDPRKTWWGSFIRKTSIDELPQFFNVLKGDMSVVGPRPERPFFVEKFKEEIPRYMVKHQVRPGITGWAQINGLRGDTSIEDRIEHDLYYIENWSFSLDIRIIILTVFKGLVNENAY